MNTYAQKQPAKRSGLTWSRTVTMDGSLLTYRLFRKDRRNKLYQMTLQFQPKFASRDLISGDLRRCRRVLRDRADEVDLVAMEAA